MCGLYLKISNKKGFESYLDATRIQSKLSNRGDDDYKTITIDNMLMAHSRLSVSDEKSATQPIKYKKNYILLFNGQIYNFKEIREYLNKKYNHCLNAQGDTEVLYEGLILEGHQFLERLTGPYAIIFINRDEGKVIFARDIIGIKPLYYKFEENNISISSVAAILFNEKEWKENYSALEKISDIIGFVPEILPPLKHNFEIVKPENIYIYDCKLNKVTLLERNDKLRDIFPLTYKKPEQKNIDYVLVKTMIKHSCYMHASKENENIVFLSGGVDSSIIFSLLNEPEINIKVGNISLNVAELKSRSENIDKKFWYEKIHKNIKITSIDYMEIKKNSLEYRKFQDLPSRDGLNIFIASKIANNQNVKICLTGAGADEVFNGYDIYSYIKVLYFPLLIINSLLSINSLNKLAQKISWRFDVFSHRDIDFDTKIYLFLRRISIKRKMTRREACYFDRVICEYKSNVNELPYIKRFRYYDIVLYLRCQLLRDADVAGLANNVDVRVPFVDQSLWKCLSEFKNIYFLQRKTSILREIFGKNIPLSCFEGKKKGFTIE